MRKGIKFNCVKESQAVQMCRMGLVVSNSTHGFQTFVGKNINIQFPGPPNYWLEGRKLEVITRLLCSLLFNSMACAGLVVGEARGVWFFAFGLCERGELHGCVYFAGWGLL